MYCSINSITCESSCMSKRSVSEGGDEVEEAASAKACELISKFLRWTLNRTPSTDSRVRSESGNATGRDQESEAV